MKIAMIAGEASGDLLGANLIQALKQVYNEELELVGIGGSKMQSLGLKSWHNMEDLSVMGYLEVIKSLPKLIKLRYTVLKELLAYKPDIFIGVDAPDFNFFLEAKLKKAGIKTVHYISPTIWAWRYKRIFKIKQSTDLMLCIFPFEIPIYQKEGINALFIGHPLANMIPMEVDTITSRQYLSLDQNQTIYTILIGSRIREINSLALTLIETCNLIKQKIPNSHFLFPAANSTTYNLIKKHLETSTSNHQFTYTILLNETRNAIIASDYCLAKSGTVSLEVALCKKPMLICYKVNSLTAWFLRRKIKIPYVGQPNIIVGQKIVKEFLQKDAEAHKMAEYMLELYFNPNLRHTMLYNFQQLHKSLINETAVSGADAILKLYHAN